MSEQRRADHTETSGTTADPDSGPAHVRRLLEQWRSNGIPYRNGVDEAELADAESRFGSLPPAFEAYYRATDGTEVPGSAEEDERGFRFFRLRECYAEHVPPSVVLFATWFEGIMYYGIGTGEPLNGAPTAFGAVYLLCDGHLKIADSFERFIDLYIADDPRLHPTGARAAADLPP